MNDTDGQDWVVKDPHKLERSKREKEEDTDK
jgi:hypothetical protein